MMTCACTPKFGQCLEQAGAHVADRVGRFSLPIPQRAQHRRFGQRPFALLGGGKR